MPDQVGCVAVEGQLGATLGQQCTEAKLDYFFQAMTEIYVLRQSLEGVLERLTIRLYLC